MEKKLRYIKLVLGLAVLIFFMIIVFLCYTLNAKSGITGKLYYSFSYTFLFLFVIYYAFTLFRIAEHKTKILTLIVFFLCVVLLFCEHTSWVSNGVTFPRYCHYFYYFSILFVPYFFFIMCNEIFTYKDKSRIVLYVILGIITLIFFLLVITNDLHQLIFKFKLDNEKSIENCTKRPLYFVLVTYALSLCLSTIIIFIVKTFRRNSIVQLLQPTFALLLFVFYSYFYINDYSFIKDTFFLNDAPLVFNLLFIILFEVLMHNGLIQNNGQYLQNFNECMLPLKIVSNDDSSIYTSFLFDDEAYRSKRDDNKIYVEKVTSNGRIIIEEDISKIISLNTKLNKNIEQLRKGNEILLKRKAIDEEQARIKVRTELFNEIEKAIYQKSNEIDFLVSLLPDTMDDTNRLYVMNILGKIRLRIGYLKQKCLLILQTKTNETISNSEFKMILNVICSDVKNTGFDYFEHAVKGQNDVLVDFALAINTLMEYVGEQFAGKRCSVLLTVDISMLRSTVRVEMVKDSIKLNDLPAETLMFGYRVTCKKDNNEYLLIMKEENNNARNL